MITLELQTNKDKKIIECTESGLSIGRSEHCDIVVDDLRMSRVQARIFIENQQLWISDQNSLNGTLINKNLLRSSSIRLNNNDQIILTPETRIIIHIGGKLPNKTTSSKINNRSTITKKNYLNFHFNHSIKNIAYLAVAGMLIVGIFVFLYLPTSPHQPKSFSRNVKKFKTQKKPSPENTSMWKEPHQPKIYNNMSGAEKFLFLKERFNYINKLISNREITIEENIIEYIKIYIDQYNSRIGTGKEGVFRDDLTFVIKRGTQFAPMINKSFKKERVSPVIGLYIAMIESEFHQCLESPANARGMFQFITKTAEEFGLDPGDRCLAELAAPAAAKYIATRIKEFNGEGDPNGVALCIAAYNRNPKSIMKDLMTIMNNTYTERSFWLLIANQEQLDRYFQSENVKYVPKFFAAAIIGETPQAFTLDSMELSSINFANSGSQ